MAHLEYAPRCVATVRCSRAELPRPFRASARARLCPGNQRKFMQGVARGLALAAKDRGLEFRLAQADNDAINMIEQVHGFLNAKVGALVVAPVDPPSIAPHLRELIWSGAYVGTVVPPPAISLLNAPQYLTGRVLAEEAADFIRTRLGGKARIVLLTHDSLEFLAPRFAAMRDVFRDMPGAVIVADISPITVDEAGGAAMMKTVLLANPDIDVVLGADTVVVGALAALRAAGKARPDQFLGGIDGEPAAIAEIKIGRRLQGQRQPCLSHLWLRHGTARCRLARRQDHSAGDGYPAAGVNPTEPRRL